MAPQGTGGVADAAAPREVRRTPGGDGCRRAGRGGHRAGAAPAGPGTAAPAPRAQGQEPGGQEWPQEHEEYEEYEEYEQYDGQGRIPGDQGQVQGQGDQQYAEQQYPQENHESPWFAAPQVPQDAYESAFNPTYVEGLEPTPVRVPAGPGRTRPLGGVVPGQRTDDRTQAQYAEPGPAAGQEPPAEEYADPESEAEELPVSGLPDDLTREEAYFNAFRKYVSEHGDFPNARQFGLYLMDLYGITGRTGGPLSESSLRGYLRDFRYRYQTELDADADAEHIA